MNLINRLEETWSPSWDLGLQDEFSFLNEDEEDKVVLETERPNAWAMASKEVLNRQGTAVRHLNRGASSVGELISFFESLITEGASHE